MFAVCVDKDHHLLRLRFAQQVGYEEAKAVSHQVRSLLLQIEPGFSLLTDLSELQSMDLACEPFIDDAMDACNRAGVQRVVRVVPEPNRDIGFGIMSLFHYGRNVRIVTCATLAEAEGLLLGDSGQNAVKP
jgi:hypothetical protein